MATLQRLSAPELIPASQIYYLSDISMFQEIKETIPKCVKFKLVFFTLAVNWTEINAHTSDTAKCGIGINCQAYVENFLPYEFLNKPKCNKTGRSPSINEHAQRTHASCTPCQYHSQ